MFDCKKLTGNKAGKNDVRLQSSSASQFGLSLVAFL